MPTIPPTLFNPLPGGQDILAVDFDYINEKYVQVLKRAHADGIDQVAFAGALLTEGLDYTWLNDGAIDLAVSGDGATDYLIQRETPTQPLVTQQPGVLSSSKVNLAVKQALHLVEELKGALTSGLSKTQAIVRRAIRVPEGETVAALPSAATRANQYLAFDPSGNPSMSSGTGADAGLREDLGTAALGKGTYLVKRPTGELLETALLAITAIETANAREQSVNARCQVPFTAVGNIPVCDLIPTASAPVAAIRLHQDWIVLRTLSTSLAGSTPGSVYFDEYVLRDPRNYSGVDGGWALVLRRAFVGDRYVSWTLSPDADGAMPNMDFAIRGGKYDAANASPAYHSGGEGPAFYFAGFGHGRMYNNRVGNQISSDGRAGNLQDIANWPVGVRVYGTFLNIGAQYKLRFLDWQAAGGADGYLASGPFTTNGTTGVVTVAHLAHGYSNGQVVHFTGAVAVGGITAAQLNTRLVVTVVNANSYTVATAGTSTSATSGGGAVVQAWPEVVTLQYDHTFNADNGMTRKGTLQASIDGYGWQDSYGYMIPMSHLSMTRMKPNGEAAVTPTRSNSSIPILSSTAGTASQYQMYNHAVPDVFQQFNLSYGVPLRRQGGGLAGWEQNAFARYFILDNKDFAKMYVHLNSSTENPATRAALPLRTTDIWEWQSYDKTTFGTPL